MRNSSVRLNNKFLCQPIVNRKAILLTALMLLVSASPFVTTSSANEVQEIEVLDTAINPGNNHTYHLLSASSWSDAASVARSLGGFLVTIDDADEDQWIFDTFAVNNETTRHLWIGLSDYQNEGDYRWHDGTPFTYRNWGDGQPGSGDDEDYVHITGTNMGSIEPASWNDLEDDPQYFPVYGVVEIGDGADYALRFDGDDDHITIDEDFPDWGNSLEIEAWVNVADTDGIQFITMFGDYGWGLYLNDGYLAYSNEYSLSRNPISNISIQENVWTHIKVVVNTETGGEFFIDNSSVGLIDVNDSQIPSGDFGSNDCFQSGEDCDELFIGRMGAGCDCNYFRGMMDDVRIGNSLNESLWMFTEGEGESTEDSQGLVGIIHGAAWVMPDGTIIAQAFELENGEYYDGFNANAGDTLLFFMEIPENTQFASLNMYSWDFEFEEEYEEIEYEIYLAKDRIPSAWDHDYEVETYYGLYVYEYFEWPEEGTYWITISSNYDIEELEVNAYWEEAPEPPELDEMTELNDGIAVTGQRITRDSSKSLYFYVELEDELAELRVKTWGGPGDCELHIALDALPYTDDWGWIEDGWFEESSGSNGRQIGGQQTSDHSYNSGNDETVQIFDAQPGIYYIMMTSYSGCRDVTIQADFTYAPNNVDPESAIELTDGISYGPLSGFDGLDQFFYIDVPVGTERLEVDLNNGDGEAKLMMRLDQVPTWSTYDKHSNAPGAGDKLGFNDPTPGRWYILLGSEEYYSRIDITASFEDRYVWTYDGEPIQLFNEEEIGGMSAPEDEELYFFIDLGDSSAMDLTIKTWGGEGDLGLSAETEEFDWEDSEERPMGRQFGETEFESDWSGADEEIYIFFASGRIDITIYANTEIEDISIVAKWDEIDEPGPGPGPDPPSPEPPIGDDILSCDEYVKVIFEDLDLNGDGDISSDESFDGDDNEFDEIDINKDGVIDKTEAIVAICTCENELYVTLEQINTDDRGEFSIEFLSSIAWKNEYDFFEMDSNNNMRVDYDEVEEYGENCVTTYDPLDRDGDGTPNDKDAFPDDPNEDKDTDGDGVGDNADIIASVDNDVIWVSASILGLVLATFLGIMFVRSRRGPEYAWEEYQKDRMSESMLAGMVNSGDMPPSQDSVPPALDLGPPVENVPEDMTVSDLYD
ncbi:MAG: hypothetical protein CMB76_01845 [Euryarchaeota archaeon]|nr:hypothetical protein [Euryarchaeota archaeon]